MTILRKSDTRDDATRTLETGFINLHNLIRLTLSPSKERDKLLDLYRQTVEATPAAIKASVYYGEKDREEVI